MRLNFGTFTDGHILLNFNKRSNKYVATNSTPIKVDWIDNSNPIAKLDIDNPDLINFGLTQNAPPSLQCLGRERK